MKTKLHYLFVVLALLAGVHRGSAQSTNFILSSTITVDSMPFSSVLADVNGDGKLDLICVYRTGTLTVLTNDGSGGFGSNATYNVGSIPNNAIAADINGDGKVDLVSVNLGDSTLTVLTNNGSAIFGSNATLNVGLNPEGVAAADVNGDGKLDLISANAGITSGNTLTVLTNDGSGVFGFYTNLTVGTAPSYVLAADVNGDGLVDLISANHYSHSLTVLTNDGIGGFSIASSPNVGNEPLCVAAADINGDGKVDLISADYGGGSGGGNTLTVLTNAGNGQFGLYVTLAVGGFPITVVAADVNGDGKVDLISADNQTPSALTVLLNNGNGVFTRADYITGSDGTIRVAVGDVNGDGKPDLVSANPGPNSGVNTLTVLTNNITFPGPQLNIASVCNQSVLFWPTSVMNYVLQSTTNLTSPNWVTASDAVPVIAVTVTNTSPARFFRLQQQQ